MTNQIKNFIEEGEKEFEEKFIGNVIRPEERFMILHTVDIPELKSFISSRQISLIKMIVEMVESERPINFTTNGQRGQLEDEVLRQMQKLVDTISSKLKEIIKE